MLGSPHQPFAASSNQSLCRVADSRSHRIGRPSRLTPVVTERLLHALRTGNARVVACRYAGISEPTFHRWMTDDRPEFRECREVVEPGEAIAEGGRRGEPCRAIEARSWRPHLSVTA